MSRALAGKGRAIGLSDERIRLICETARTLGYRPNASARAVRAGRFGQVALMLSVHRERSRLPEETLAGICEALDGRDLQLTLARLPDEKLTDAGVVPRILRELCSDAMLIDYTDHIPDRMIELIEGSGQPAVWLNRKHHHDCVYPDDVALGRQATERLLAAGHRRIAYLDWGAGWKQLDSSHYSQRDRQAGYEEAMEAAGLTPQPIRREDSDLQVSQEGLCKVLEGVLARKDRPTALVAYAPHFARRAAAAGRRRGLHVPEDLSLVTISGGDQLTLDDGRLLDTAHVPEREYGLASVEIALEKLAAPGRRLAPRAVAPPAFVEGETVAPPAREAE